MLSGVRPDGEAQEFAKNYMAWLDEVGLDPGLIGSLHKDNDWTFVIKLHAILEAALNHLILSRLGAPTAEIVEHLETNNARTGKIAFINAYELLPKNCVRFIRSLSEVRNRAVHDFKNFDLDLKKYLAAQNPDQQRNWKLGLTSYLDAYDNSKKPQELLDLAMENPRICMMSCCVVIMMLSFESQPHRARQRYEEFLAGQSSKPTESNPKK